MVGLPGTGLGGLFYVALTIWMALREGLRATGGRSNFQRWSRILPLCGISAGIVIALWLQWILIKLVFRSLATAEANTGLASSTVVSHWSYAEGIVPALALFPVALLAVLLASLAIVARILRTDDYVARLRAREPKEEKA